jgi:hypothetical protein
MTVLAILAIVAMVALGGGGNAHSEAYSDCKEPESHAKKEPDRNP